MADRAPGLEVDPDGRVFTRIGRHRVEVVTRAEAEQVAFVVCVRTDQDPGVFVDNVHTVCAMCGVGIIHRPHVPKEPPKLCTRCALRTTERGES